MSTFFKNLVFHGFKSPLCFAEVDGTVFRICFGVITVQLRCNVGLFMARVVFPSPQSVGALMIL